MDMGHTLLALIPQEDLLLQCFSSSRRESLLDYPAVAKSVSEEVNETVRRAKNAHLPPAFHLHPSICWKFFHSCLKCFDLVDISEKRKQLIVFESVRKGQGCVPGQRAKDGVCCSVLLY